MTTTSTPQFERVLLAMARMAEGIAEAARLLAASEDTEAEGSLMAVSESDELLQAKED